ncbi:MAG TPA: ATP12 family protein [Allosphingosinicella sp.]
MKRFYKQAAVSPEEGGVAITLDGRPVRTPGRALLRVPTEELADAIAGEWNGQGEEIDPRSMPLTGLANAAIDRVAPDPTAFGRTLAEYGESDLLCYRADGPQSLVERQSRVWDPLLGWARTRFDIEIETTTGVMHRRQPSQTVERLGHAVAARSAFQLAGLAPLVTIAGSLIIALALAEGAIGLETAWDAAMLDEAWQAEQWGADPLAAASLENRRRDFEAAYLFLTLL